MRNVLGHMVTLSLVGSSGVVQASRVEHFNAPFTRYTANNEFVANEDRYCRWDYRNGRTRQNFNYSYPQAPIFGAYDVDAGLITPGRGPRFHYNLKLPVDFFEVLPASVRAKIRHWGIPAEMVDIFLVIQDLPWKDDVDILLRPHGWTDPDAPWAGEYHNATKIRVGLFEAPPQVRFRGHAGEAFPATITVHHHPPLGDLVLSSPDNLQLDGLDRDKSTAVFTLVRGVVQGKDRVAATLSVLLNRADDKALEPLVPGMDTLAKLAKGLKEHFRGASWAGAVRQLTRPMVDGEPTVGKVTGREDVRSLVFRGSGFTGTRAFQLDGHNFLVRPDDSAIEIRVPREMADKKHHVLAFESPLGRFRPNRPEPAPLPDAPEAGPHFSLALNQGNLWTGKTTLTIPAEDTTGEYANFPCQPGDVITGEGFVQAKGLTRGKVQVNLAFTGDGQTAYGEDLDGRRPFQTGSAGRTHLGVRGTTPSWAKTVQVCIQALGCNPGAEVTYDSVEFRRSPAEGKAAQPAFWKPAKEALTVPAEGTIGEYANFSCQPGEVFTGEGFLQAKDLTQGKLQVNLAFIGADGKVAYGEDLDGSRPFQTGSAGRTHLGVRGIAPSWARTVQVCVQALGCDPGAVVSYDSVEFRRFPAEGKAVQPAFWKPAKETLTVPGDGSIGDYANFPCYPGEVFTGEGFAQATGLNRGKLQVNLAFIGDDGKVVYGEDLDGDRPFQTGSAGRTHLGVRGTAPSWARTVQVCVQALGCDPGAVVTFDSVAFRRPLEEGKAAQPGLLWQPKEVLAHGEAYPSHQMVLPCTPGEEFTGECFVETEGLDKGQARIGMVFTNGPDLVLSHGHPLADGLPMESSAPGRVHMGVLGTAPKGANQVKFYLEIAHCEPKGKARFDTVVFRRSYAPAIDGKAVEKPPAERKSN